MTPNLSFLETLARQAGEILRAGFGKQHIVEHKGAIDLVTEMDKCSEAFLLDAITQRFPTHRIIAEENGEQAGDPQRLWYIDPLDGTVNYAHGIPIYCVSIAYAEQGQLKLGVVFDPMQDECFSAERGKGAYLNGQPIRVSDASELGKSLLVTGFPYDVWSNPVNNLDNYARFAVCTQGVRRLGSAALDLCYVAAGRFDGYWELYLYPWDLAAGALIAEEAGAVITRSNGSPDYLDWQPSALAANPQLHPRMLAVLQET